MFSLKFHEVVQAVYQDLSSDYLPDETEDNELVLLLSCGTALILSEPECELVEIRAPLVVPPDGGLSSMREKARVHIPWPDVDFLDVDGSLAVAGIRLKMTYMPTAQCVRLARTFREFVETCWNGSTGSNA